MTARHVDAELAEGRSAARLDDLLDSDARLSADTQLRADVRDAVLAQLPALATRCNAEVEELEKALPVWTFRHALVLAATMIVPTVLIIMARDLMLPPETLVEWILLLTLLTATALTVAVVLVATGQRRAAVRLAVAQFDKAMRRQLGATVAQETVKLDSDATRWSNSFRATKAPYLVEIDLKDTVSSAGYDGVLSFLRSHRTSAIGIAGSRGAGKSTLMNQLRHDTRFPCIGIRVAAPVSYAETDLVRMIHWELAEGASAWARRHRTAADSPYRPKRLTPDLRERIVRPLAWAAAAFSLIPLMLLWAYDRGKLQDIADTRVSYGEVKDVQIFQIGYLGVVAVVGIAVVATLLLTKAWQVFQTRARLDNEPANVEGSAAYQLNWLRWVTSTESTAKTSVKAGLLGAEGQNKYSRMERDRSHADSVRALQRYITRLVTLTRPEVSVLICVDELDKMARPEDAVRMINGLKDLFHIEGAHFLVSVSTDALFSFAARGVPMRDVFDSSFDAMICVKPLSFAECRDVIAGRARDVTSTAALFCYIWSGGNARDLIRSARHCVEFRHSKDTDVPIAAAVARVLTDDLAEVLDAALERLGQEGLHDALDNVLAFRELLDERDASLPDILAAALRDAPLPAPARDGSEAMTLAAALDPYARVAGLTALLFSTERTPEQWQSPGLLAAADALAAARAGLGKHASEVRRLVTTAIVRCTSVFDADAARQFDPPALPTGPTANGAPQRLNGRSTATRPVKPSIVEPEADESDKQAETVG